jgi:nitric oxide reductase subunit B
MPLADRLHSPAGMTTNPERSLKRSMIVLAVVVAGSFAVLGASGVKLHRELPPIPGAVTAPGGQAVLDGASIRRGQEAWQSIGGQELGSVWGHGAYVAPDWTADWLHREATAVLELWSAREDGRPFEQLGFERQAALRARLVAAFRTNTWNAARDAITLDGARAQVYPALAAQTAAIFRDGVDAYAIPRGALKDPQKLIDLAAFFWWTSWAASTERPGEAATYTQNWPAEELVGNKPTAGIVLWSLVSVVLLIAAVGALVWWQASRPEPEAPLKADLRDRLFGAAATPSQRATVKYFLVVAALFLVQLLMGGLTAHYGVEGTAFFGFPLAKYLPYSVTRSWHTQLGIFWIATAWLATGLYVAPAVGGGEPRFQRFGVNVLFGALLVIVVGALTGQWLSIQQRLGGTLWYWFGHQGYEYVDLGRFWQIFLFAGLFIWLGLMLRALWPALKKPSVQRPLIGMFVLSSLAIALFYGAGLMYGRGSHLGSVEYWRWWVVHLWVEGFFEVFATVVVAFLFVRLGLLEVKSATRNVVGASAIFLAGGILGTYHHLYFTGAPAMVLALGSIFSALEIVPLVLVGAEAWHNLKLARGEDAVTQYRWPIYFFVAVAFWNLVGAGVFGFLINPPIALYYVQGLNTTPLHGHTALFGVYGMLGIGLMLFCLRSLYRGPAWRTGALKWGFWLMNGGLSLMVVLSLLPIGLLQAHASIERGFWYARSAEFLQQPLLQQLRWLRVPGDIAFGAGAVLIAWFVIGLRTGWSLQPGTRTESAGEAVPAGVTA